jgi:hypothetical protein
MNAKQLAVTSFLMVALVAFVAVGCSDDDDGVNSNSPSKVVGTWELTSVTVDGTPANLADVFEWEQNTVGSRVILNSDFTYSAREYDASNNDTYTESGTWEVDDNWLIIWATSENGSPITKTQVLNAQWSVSGNTMTLTALNQGSTIELTATKVVT